MQEGAVHSTRLLVAALRAAASEPVLAVQANVRELSWGALAVTSKETVWPGPLEADWLKEVKRGGKRSREGVVTQRLRAPWVCPPRPSWTVTVRRQLLQAPAGTEEGTKEAALEVASVKVPGQEAAH